MANLRSNTVPLQKKESKILEKTDLSPSAMVFSQFYHFTTPILREIAQAEPRPPRRAIPARTWLVLEPLSPSGVKVSWDDDSPN